MSRQSIGFNPLDALLETSEEKPIKPAKTKKFISKKVVEKSPAFNKQRLTVQISGETVERAKNAVYWTRGLTLAQLTEEALERAVSALEKSSVIYDDKTGKPIKEKGDAFPKRNQDLKSGRPVK